MTVTTREPEAAARTIAPVPIDAVGAELRRAVGRIAPAWPLDRFVAVNPYVGLTDHRFADAAQRLATVAGARSTLPVEWYLGAVASGRVTVEDVDTSLRALDAHRSAGARDGHELLALARRDASECDAARTPRVPTVAAVATACTGIDWGHLATDRISAWAASYFDAGQALWPAARPGDPPYAAWRFEAEADRTPEVMGLRGFRRHVRSLPDDPGRAAAAALAGLAVPDAGLDRYLHAVATGAGGWLAHAARLAFEARLHGGDDPAPVELLVVALCWELGIARCVRAPGFREAWARAREELSRAPARDATAACVRRVVLHEAFERAERRRFVTTLSRGPGAAGTSHPPVGVRPVPEVQAVFCIDVRSEVLRRHLESAAPSVETLGFAGFFGMPVAYAPLGLDGSAPRCPVLLTPSHTVAETLDGDGAATAPAVAHRRAVHHVRRAWKSFKMGAVSCFGFVGPVGLAYLPKLFGDAWGRSRPVPAPRTDALPRGARGSLHPDTASIPMTDRVALAEGALRGMSLTRDLAPVVLLCGHGATTTNNPYDSALACGACGGFDGEVNARVAAAVLNDPQVRDALAGRGIEVPPTTWFVAARHDTTTDDVTCFDLDRVPAAHAATVARLRCALDEAARRARAERAQRLGVATPDADDAVRRRARDWAQVRPEWGLAGCRAFVAAPRARTAGLDLGGRVFLHSYDCRADDGFAVLELIMTAPMVVASWINLQYFGSTVDNERFGSGDKTLHNVVGRLGVFEGTAGDLRVGLPWQSVHDGRRLQHEPLRLTVAIEAPTEAISAVLDAHPEVRALCANGWVHLHAMADDGTVAWRYAGDAGWVPCEP